ncbi:zinc ribbon domain-containing protein [bacterium]|nr:zinc ribbon domain-containing protein [bacterium]
MPTYEYECTACGHKFEEWQSITADPITKCPECKKKKVKRLLGTGGAIIFKGSGYYQTDYRSESYKKAEKADSASSSSDSKSSESKSSTSADGAGSASSSPAPAEKKTESKLKKNDSKK